MPRGQPWMRCSPLVLLDQVEFSRLDTLTKIGTAKVPKDTADSHNGSSVFLKHMRK
jgi:hypothetical protein